MAASSFSFRQKASNQLHFLGKAVLMRAAPWRGAIRRIRFPRFSSLFLRVSSSANRFPLSLDMR